MAFAFPDKQERERLSLQEEWQPRHPLEPITPVGDNSVIGALEKSIPYLDAESKYYAEAELKAYKNRK
jgi:hypothetical protein